MPNVMKLDRVVHNLLDVRRRIAEAAARSGRSPESVRLVAVTKKRPAEAVRVLVDQGQVDLGESYPQELWRKVADLPDPAIRWHLIGHLQSNKAKRTLPMVRFVHGVDTWKLLAVLDEIAATMPDPPQVCLQVNTSGEESKHGWSPDEILADADRIASLQHIPIAGLMTMAAFDDDPDAARPAFARLREIAEQLRNRTGLALPELSMGMSNDYEPAIEEGATLVRVGSALFEGLDE